MRWKTRAQIDGPEAWIPVRSRERAMDWSLVLLSQSIDCRIDRIEDGWYVVVAAEGLGRSLAVLRQYQWENRSWVWRPATPNAAVGFHAGALFWCLLIAFFYAWADRLGDVARDQGMMSRIAVLEGEWWRLFTAITLHGDLAHLMANLCFGLILLGLAMARCGMGAALAAAWLAGALGNVLTLLASTSERHSLGASGMVMAALGILAAASYRDYRAGQIPARLLIRGLVGGVLLFVLLGLAPGSDVVAHSGGFVAGLMLGAVIAWLPERLVRSPAFEWGCGLLFVGSIIISWALALSAGPRTVP